MSIYLKIGGIDAGRFLTSNNYSVEDIPVYDDESAFVNIYGEKIRKKTGRRVTVKALLMDVDETSAESLSAALGGENVNVIYSAPDQREAVFETVKFRLSLDRVVDGEKFWSAETELLAPFVPEDGL